MDSRVIDLSGYSGKRVLVTGHTGWKGAWLSLWLIMLGAEVIGYSPEVKPGRRLYGELGLNRLARHERGDILDLQRLEEVFSETTPQYVFHLAGQALAGGAMADPVGAFELNVMGTVGVLEACRKTASVRSVIFAGSHRSYLERPVGGGFRENDAVGGIDPYGGSKTAAEMAVTSYGQSFLQKRKCGWAMARTTNLIGGGDWSEGRIVPDCAAAVSLGRPIVLKSPEAVCPWMHVLDPLRGYLLLGLRLSDDPTEFSGAWNFGPRLESLRTVRELAEMYVHYRGAGEIRIADGAPLERGEPSFLVNDKARTLLGWSQVWGFEQAVAETASWSANELAGGSIVEFCRSQVKSHMLSAVKQTA